MKYFSLKNLFFFGFLVVFLGVGLGQTVEASNEKIASAMKDLSQATGQNVTTKEEAATVCDLEKFLTTCTEIGKKYNLYDPSQVKQVDTLVNEIKGQIESDLKSCLAHRATAEGQTTECLMGVAEKLSQKLSAKNPKLAEQADLSVKSIQKKQETLQAAQQKDRAFKDAIKSGDFQCGDGTVDGCGNFCLNPSADTKSQGASAIPSVCREIAQKYFGAEGEQHLESAYQQVKDVRNSYLKKAQSLTFQTVGGQTITNPQDIGKYMEEQGKAGNVQAVEKGMQFMVNNGLVKPEEKDFALKMVQQVKVRGGLPDLDACSKNPAACKDFIPEDLRGQFEAQSKIKEIVKQEGGIDPQQCANSNDPTVGQKCLDGAKKAIEKLRSLGDQNPNTQRIIQDLQQKVSNREQFQNKKQQLQQVIQQQGGPGGCKSEEECRSFCSDTANGQQCFSFGAKQGVSGFQGSEGQERVQEFNHKFQQVQQNQQGPFGGQGQNVSVPKLPSVKDESPDFQKDRRDFQRERQNQFEQKQPGQFKHQNMPNMMPPNQFQSKPGESINPSPSGRSPEGGQQQQQQFKQPEGNTQYQQPSGGTGPSQFQQNSNFGTGTQASPPPSSGGGSQPPPPPPPKSSSLLNNSLFGGVARAFIKISN